MPHLKTFEKSREKSCSVMAERNKIPLFKHLQNDGIVFMPLNENQEKALSNLNTKLQTGEYQTTPLPCLCGSNDDILIASKDRYGLSLDTSLCMNCGLMRSDPYLDEKTLSLFYRDDYRDIYIPAIVEKRREVNLIFRDEYIAGQSIKNFIGDMSHCKTIFEIGCGAGGTLAFFNSLGMTTVGCDYGRAYVEFGLEQGLDIRLGGISQLLELQKGGIRADIVILHHVLEHFRDPVAEINKIAALLSEKGHLFIALPGIFSMRKYYGSLLPFLQNAHVWHFCLKSLDFLMEACGFRQRIGSELIYALYYKIQEDDLKKDWRPRHNVGNDILKYLTNIEKIRWLPTARYLIRKLLPQRTMDV